MDPLHTNPPPPIIANVTHSHPIGNHSPDAHGSASSHDGMSRSSSRSDSSGRSSVHQNNENRTSTPPGSWNTVAEFQVCGTSGDSGAAFGLLSGDSRHSLINLVQRELERATLTGEDTTPMLNIIDELRGFQELGSPPRHPPNSTAEEAGPSDLEAGFQELTVATADVPAGFSAADPE